MTKEEIIEGIKNEFLYFKDLDEFYKNDKDLFLEVFKQKEKHYNMLQENLQRNCFIRS